MITILQIPTNVTPDDECVVIDKTTDVSGEYINAPRFSYTFHGDELRWGLCEYFNNATEERIARSYMPRYGDMPKTYHNGDTVRINALFFNGKAQNGKNYKYRYTLFQTDPMTNEGEYNIYFCQGKIRAVPSGETQTNNEVYINTEIENLKDAYRYTKDDGTTILVGGAYMEINEERRFIESYDFNTGKVVLESAFSSYPSKGTTFKIFTNYILTPYYFVKCRKLPKSTLTVTKQFDGLYCQLTYNQANHVGLKCYKVALYKTSSDGGNYIDGYVIDKNKEDSTSIKIRTGLSTDIIGKKIRIEEEPGTTPSDEHVTDDYIETKIMSYDSTSGWLLMRGNHSKIQTGARYTIVDDVETLIEESEWLYTYDLDYKFYTNYVGNSYRIEYTVITQDDVDVTKNKTKKYSNSSYRVRFDNLNSKIIHGGQNVTFSWDGINLVEGDQEPTHLAVYRKENISDQNPVLLRYDKVEKYHRAFVDWTAANNHDYYYIFAFYSKDIEAQFRPITTDVVHTNWNGWSLIALTDEEDYCNRHAYSVDGVWSFLGGLSSDDITTHIGVAPHTMTGIKPKVTRNDESYESGSFSAYVSSLDCEADSENTDFKDDIERVKAWIKFSSRKCDYILKSDKGDSWVINITDNPTRNYDNSTLELLTTINYSWTECEDINRIILKG